MSVQDVLVPPVRAGSVDRLALSPAELAEALGICRASVYNLIARGELHVIKIGRSTRIPIAEAIRLAGGGADAQ